MTEQEQRKPPNPQLLSGPGLRRAAEQLLEQRLSAAPGDLESTLPEASQLLLHDLRVHQIELQMQNEELLLAQEDIASSLEAYRDLYDLAPIGYCSVDTAGVIIKANLRAAALFGVEPNDLSHQQLTRYIDPQDQDSYYLLRQQVQNSKASRSIELRLPKGARQAVWVQLTATAAIDKAGQSLLLIVLTDVTDRRLSQAALQSSLQEKVALLNEVHHRVKNNLQVITSLLRLETHRGHGAAIKSVLDEMQGRIRSMALLHELLYREGSFATVDLGQYLTRLCTEALRAMQTPPGQIKLELKLASVNVNMDQAMPCGLLVNELISNCVKHAFPDGRQGTVKVELQPLEGKEQYQLRVSDDGIGLPADFEVRRKTSLGLQLVGDLAVQLGSSLAIGPGASFSLSFLPGVMSARPA
jgi:PAS domain S-box-containing protein